MPSRLSKYIIHNNLGLGQIAREINALMLALENVIIYKKIRNKYNNFLKQRHFKFIF